MINMKRVGAICLTFVATLGLSRASAQYPTGDRAANPNAGPAVSPYLNLLRRGSSAGVNYYGLVRPDLEFRSAFRGIQQQIDSQRLDQGIDTRGLPETGHPSSFLDTRGYFLNIAPIQRGGPPSGPSATVGGAAASRSTAAARR